MPTTTHTVAMTTAASPSLSPTVKSSSGTAEATGLPLHLLPPFSSSPSTSVLPTAADGISPAPTGPTGLLAFPHGAAPLPPLSPNPLGISSSNGGPAYSFMMLAISIAATLQLCLSARKLQYEIRGSRVLKKIPSSKVRFLLSSNPYTLQFVSLLHLNLFALPLLLHLVRLEAHWESNVPGIEPYRIFHAGRAGLFLSMLAWGLTFSGIRIVVSFARWIFALQTARQNVRQTERKTKHVWTGVDIFVRSFGLELLGSAFPAAVVGFSALRWWSWNAGYPTAQREPKLSPVDYMPALYWDGMWDSFHGYLLEYVFSLGLWIALVPGAVLMMMGMDWENNWHGKFMRKFVPLSPIWLGFMAWLLLMLVGLLFSMFCMGVHWVVGSPSEAVDVWVERGFELFTAGLYYPLTPAMAVLGVVWFAVMALPAFALWYVGFGWWFGGIDVSRSCFFLPCSERKVSGIFDWAMITTGAFLIIHHSIYLWWIVEKLVPDLGMGEQEPLPSRTSAQAAKEKGGSKGRE